MGFGEAYEALELLLVSEEEVYMKGSHATTEVCVAEKLKRQKLE